MIEYIKRNRNQNLFLFMLIASDMGLYVIGNYMRVNVVNELIAKNIRSALAWLALSIVLFLIMLIARKIENIKIELATQTQLNMIREDIIGNLIESEFEVFQQHSVDEYNSWLNNDASMIEVEGYKEFYYVVQNICLSLFSGIALLKFHWLLLLVTIGLSVIMLFIPRIFKEKLGKVTQSVSDSAQEALKASGNYLGGYEILFNNSQLSFLQEKIKETYEKLKQTKVNKAKLVSTVMVSTVGMSFLSQTLILGLNAYLAFTNSVTIGTLLVSGSFAANVFNGLNAITDATTSILSVAKLFEKYPKKAIQEEGMPLNFTNQIVAQNLSVTLGEQVIHYPDFMIKKGGKYAIVGESGSGKSTLVTVLTGKIRSFEGNLRIDQLDYRNLNAGTLRNLFTVVMQTPYLFKGSIEENLKIGREVSDELLAKVAVQTDIEDFVKREESSVESLSGGQKQRLALAREMISNKNIVILDESTSSLDKQKALKIEHEILKNPELTVVMITHHLSEATEQLLDEVIRL